MLNTLPKLQMLVTKLVIINFLFHIGHEQQLVTMKRKITNTLDCYSYRYLVILDCLYYY